MKKITSLLMAVLLLATTLTLAAIPASAEASEKYIVRSWDGNKVVETATDIPTNAINITDSTNTLEAGKWYVVSGNVTVSKITVNGTENSPTSMILTDGCTLTVQQGIFLEENHTLHIYGQELDSGTIFATGVDNTAGIGGVYNGERTFGNAGNLTVFGGTVNATGGDNGAGIGGSFGCLSFRMEHINIGGGGTLTVYGGLVNATGGDNGAGIGGGRLGNGGTVTVYGGTVNATGGTDSAGIGGGTSRDLSTMITEGFVNVIIRGPINSEIVFQYGGNGGDVNVYGGTVNAVGNSSGAGIGGGGCDTGSLDVGGGNGDPVTGSPTQKNNNIKNPETNLNTSFTVEFIKSGNGGNVKVYGGAVNATGGKSGGAGIGGGKHHQNVRYSGDGGNVEIMGGTVTATGSRNAQGIGHGDGAQNSGNLKLYDFAIIKVGKGIITSTYNGEIYVNIHYNTAESVASVFSDGNWWIIIAVAVLALGGVTVLIILKKKKKSASAVESAVQEETQVNENTNE